MKKRILTACIGVPFLILCLIVRGLLAEVVIMVLSLVAMIECYRALDAAKYHPFPWGAYAAAIIMLPLARWFNVRDPLLLMAAAMGVTMAGVIFSAEPTFPNAAVSVYPIFTSLMPMSMLMLMLNSTYGEVPGVALITMAFAIAFVGDGVAYFGGSRFGKRKLCPNLSPHKTVEGAAFYFAGSLAASLVTRAVFVYGFGYAMPGVPAAIILGIVGGAAGQVGDLTASMLKRYSGIKDYGKIFPGHGGVMDRFDSVLYTLIVLYCYTLLLK